MKNDEHTLRLIDEGRIVCDPSTGVILVDGRPMGYRSRGYNRICVGGYYLMSHRVVYLYVHRHIPPGYVINHRDGNGMNNRIENLEAVTQRQNTLHARRSRNYRSPHHDKAENWAEPDPDTTETLMQQPPSGPTTTRPVRIA